MNEQLVNCIFEILSKKPEPIKNIASDVKERGFYDFNEIQKTVYWLRKLGHIKRSTSVLFSLGLVEKSNHVYYLTSGPHPISLN